MSFYSHHYFSQYLCIHIRICITYVYVAICDVTEFIATLVSYLASYTLETKLLDIDIFLYEVWYTANHNVHVWRNIFLIIAIAMFPQL